MNTHDSGGSILGEQRLALCDVFNVDSDSRRREVSLNLQKRGGGPIDQKTAGSLLVHLEIGEGVTLPEPPLILTRKKRFNHRVLNMSRE